jgi:hypothetical protein
MAAHGFEEPGLGQPQRPGRLLFTGKDVRGEDLGWAGEEFVGASHRRPAIAPLMRAWRASSLSKVSKIQTVVGDVRAAYQSAVPGCATARAVRQNPAPASLPASALVRTAPRAGLRRGRCDN